MDDLFEAISFYTVLNGRNRPSGEKGARMNKLLKAAAAGALLYGAGKVGHIVGYLQGTIRTAFLYGKDKAWGHRMVDKYADLYEKEKKEA